jgi:two-component system cell cycle sensor histidine kinase/response regulator CckA
VNARDAMAVAEGGTLTIKTENVTLDSEFCRSHAGAKPGAYVLLSISDTGHGMEEETTKRMFDPFYTTKEVGEGTGLGLSAVYGIVGNHGGFITFTTQPGAGTIFKIYFPAVDKMEKPPKEKKIEGELGGNETILLVDDEDYILEIGNEILTLFGYRVLTRPNCEGALDFYRTKKDRIDIIILDLIMPGLGGKRCLKELLKINPDVKVIVTSGYSAVSSKKEIFAEGAKGVIDKPFEMKQLLREIRNVLDD